MMTSMQSNIKYLFVEQIVLSFTRNILSLILSQMSMTASLGQKNVCFSVSITKKKKKTKTVGNFHRKTTRTFVFNTVLLVFFHNSDKLSLNLFFILNFAFTKSFSLGRFSHRVAMSICLCVCFFVCLRHRMHFFRPLIGPEIT